MQGNVNIPDSTITTNLSFRQLVLINMQQLTNFPYIEKDFDALTDYELLCLVVKFLNDVIANQNEQNDSITRMYESFLALQTYVNNTKDTLEDAFNELDDYVRNYFDNLDVQEEINNKLDQMLEDGVLEQIIEQFLQLTSLLCFNNVAEMKSSVNLTNGSFAKTLGYYAINDGGESTYKIRTKTNEDVTNEQNLVAIGDSLVAELIIEESTINPIQFGCYGDGTHDDTDNLQDCIDYAIANKLNICIIKDLKVSPKNMEDNTKVCLTIYRDSSDNSHIYDSNIEMYFKRDSKIFTESTDECTLIRMNINNMSIVNPYLKGVKGKTILLEMSKIDKLSTTEVQWTCHNIIRNAKLQNALKCISMQGNTYYNTFDNIYIINTDMGIILEMTELEKTGVVTGSNVNRNEFSNVVMTNVTSDNKCGGLLIEYGDTNKFVNLSFEGVKNPIYIDDPHEHTSDFILTPQWYTADNMFVNVTMEASSGTKFYNNSRGTKVININLKYDDTTFVIPAQTYMGGVDAAYSPEIALSMYKSLEDLAAPNLKKYSVVCSEGGGFGARTFYDVLYNKNDGFNPLTLTNFEFDTTDGNVSAISYENKKIRVKSIGGMLFFIGKIRFTPVNTSGNLILKFPASMPWLTVDSIYTFELLTYMRLPIIVNVNGTMSTALAIIKQDRIEIVPPSGGWNSGNENYVFMNLSLLRNGVTY